MKHTEFERYANSWWAEDGPFDLLHKMNPTRLKYIRDNISQNLANDVSGLKAIDIGCGGGILTIPMARMGMEVHGLDLGEKNINIAISASEEAGLDIQYYSLDLSKLASDPEHQHRYDVVTCMEVLEHVDDYKIFLIHLSKLLKPGGLLFISTINRTLKSLAGAVVAAEYVMKIVPKGTHQWSKFIKPSEIVDVMSALQLNLVDLAGLHLNPINSCWSTSEDVSINYIMCVSKK